MNKLLLSNLTSSPSQKPLLFHVPIFRSPKTLSPSSPFGCSLNIFRLNFSDKSKQKGKSGPPPQSKAEQAKNAQQEFEKLRKEVEEMEKKKEKDFMNKTKSFQILFPDGQFDAAQAKKEEEEVRMTKERWLVSLSDDVLRFVFCFVLIAVVFLVYEQEKRMRAIRKKLQEEKEEWESREKMIKEIEIEEREKILKLIQEETKIDSIDLVEFVM
eukprot:TRINITY_DN5643_c0_g1_i1.p1 TRINITY_DN5643_c0_g1~~TRINITY_DN5643_c0_g1_i1.p1  ORF type:complete len:232 (-),score=99.05 TRINITY_DN5643_c0_g1_i1:90-728(-)